MNVDHYMVMGPPSEERDAVWADLTQCKCCFQEGVCPTMSILRPHSAVHTCMRTICSNIHGHDLLMSVFRSVFFTEFPREEQAKLNRIDEGVELPNGQCKLDANR